MIRFPCKIGLTNGHSTHGISELQNIVAAEGWGEVFCVLEADEFDAQVCVAGWFVDGKNLGRSDSVKVRG